MNIGIKREKVESNLLLCHMCPIITTCIAFRSTCPCGNLLAEEGRERMFLSR